MKRKVERFKGQIVITGIAVFAVVVSMIGGSYAIFSSSTQAGEYNVVKAGNLEISYVEGDNGDVLSLNGTYPTADPVNSTELNRMVAYRFSITNTGNIPLDYRIRIENDEAIITEDGCGSNLLGFNYIKYNFDKTLNNGTPVTNLLSNTTNHIIYDSAAANQPGLQPGASQIHDIILWIDSSAPNSVLGKHFHGKVVVDSIQSGVDMRLATEYTQGQAVTLVDGSTWHVLKNSSSTNSTVKLLKDANVDTKEFDTENLRPQDNNSYCDNDTHGCNIYDNNGSTVIKDSSIKTWLETTYYNTLSSSITTNGGTTEDLTVSLPSMEELVKANKNSSKKFTQTVFTFDTNTDVSYLTSTSYWTKTAVKGNDSSYVWYVNSSTGQSAPAYANDDTVGVRPVIVTSKLNIQ